MVSLTCPWCESDQRVELMELGDEFVCPECSTSIVLVDAAEQPELALAA
jgi:DNA-directed RNA polymerase subunit RPC12/RpoP